MAREDDEVRVVCSDVNAVFLGATPDPARDSCFGLRMEGGGETWSSGRFRLNGVGASSHTLDDVLDGCLQVEFQQFAGTCSPEEVQALAHTARTNQCTIGTCMAVF
eukprot:scaffold188804_cov19-Tisochrysis_lutea.AAC.1